jgi:hypothetical protein
VPTICPDGTPNLSPKGTTTLWDDEHIIFADFHSPATVANLERNPAAEVNVVDVFLRKGYTKGSARVSTEECSLPRECSLKRPWSSFFDEARRLKKAALLAFGRSPQPDCSPRRNQIGRPMKWDLVRNVFPTGRITGIRWRRDARRNDRHISPRESPPVFSASTFLKDAHSNKNDP